MRIATRSSKLALKQVDIFKDLYKTQEINFEIKTQITEGDRKSKKGENLFDKAHFVEDLESSLLNYDADIAIHSLKDMSCHDTEGLEIYAAIEHQSRSDVMVYKDQINLNDLANIKIGTSSLRRTRQCKHFLKNNNCSEIRGNIDTRLLKLYEDKFDAIILAKAGIERLGLNVNFIDLDFLPAIGQGIIAVQCRSDDKKTKTLLDQIKSTSFDALVDLNTNFCAPTSMLAFELEIPIKIGFDSIIANKLYTVTLERNKNKFLENNFEMIERLLGIEL